MSSSDHALMPSTLPSHSPSTHADAARREPQFVRVAETRRATLHFYLDGEQVAALQGDTLLTAVLMQQRHVRESEFSGAPRAGFCLIGACQDCWMRTEDGKRVRACSTLVSEGMRVLTRLATTAAGADAGLGAVNKTGDAR
ncbi:2Fe-2S iron-sulfur cluster protein [Paraburkholderia sp. BL6669N2]|uniref:(2Fe-2S)-binding protein n=1 Tax=Paraburkholderia sp. BL6669N2 TaxID=1938807 RepID=UPI000E24EA8C|nr:(2Fe-2S)-binding protein [Paraburkholderia sp. BL6669N2]REG51948.1 2Fe-2S iron-sulfur cluster protein [Paraburkholderia sp. BL6669N2]